MAEESINNKSWEETCRETISQYRDYIFKPFNWFMRFLPAMCVLVCAVVIGRLWWYNLANPNRCLEIVDLFREGIGTSIWTNIILILGVIYASITLFLSVLLRPQWWHLPIYIITITYICVIPQWEPLQTVIPNWSYPLLLTYALIIIGFVELCLLIIDKVAKEQVNELPSVEHGFVVKTDKDNMIITGWDKYIETIFELVGQNQLAEESFAIGIAGKWGSGKTTFYEAIKRKIDNEKNFILCEFKPWQILEPERITPEFFAEFAKVLSNESEEQNKLLRDNIIKYAQLLTAVPEVSGMANKIAAIIGKEEKSIQTLRNDIDKQLKKSKTNIAVLIDDLDRLNKDELLEIMRLVRASANFKHVLFVLTYDKDYFGQVLGKKKGVEYLKKIVNAEISLPSIEQYKYGELLEKSVSTIFNENIAKHPEDKVLIQNMLSHMARIIRDENSRAEESLLYQKLSNFRDIKRFANQFGLALRCISNRGILKQYNMYDLFWLEFLHYIDESTYIKLKRNYQDYLHVVRSHNGIGLLKIKDEIRENNDLNVLWYLFPDRSQVPPENSMEWTSNYYAYFAYRELENYVPATEFKFFLSANNKESVAKQIIDWLKDDHKRDSVFQHLQDYPYQSTFSSDHDAENYTYALLKILSMATKNATIELIVDIFKRKYKKSFFANVKEYNPASTIRDMIVEKPEKRWNKVLSIMCLTWTEDMMEIEPNSHIIDEIEYVINIQELKELAQLNYKSYFRRKDMPFDALFDSKSEYTQFIEQADYISEVHGYKPHIEETYSNLLGDYLFERFKASIKKRKKGDAVFTRIYNNLFEYSGADFVHNEDGSPDLLKQTIERTLGSMKNFETLLKECFNLNQKNVNICEKLSLNIEKARFK